MQKKLLRTIIFVIIMLLVLSNSAIAMEVVNWDDSDVEESISETADDSRVSEDVADEEEVPIGSTNEDVDRNASSNAAAGKTVTSSTSTSQPSKTYSTVATIPEANLSLNNILNVILIAVGVIIILLAIAILIKLK